MKNNMIRRDFLTLTLAGSALCMTRAGAGMVAFPPQSHSSKVISPGCRDSKVKIARIYMGSYHGLWPKPNLDFKAEIRMYKNVFARLKDELSDVDFVVDELVTSPDQIHNLKDKMTDIDGIVAIHFNIGINAILAEILKLGHPTLVFADPYSGHEWVGFGNLRNQPLGSKMECMLTSDYKALGRGIRPFRAIHHLKKAKIIDLSTRSYAEYAGRVKKKFGTEIKQIGLDRMLDVYHSIRDKDAKNETEKWIQEADKIVEPTEEEIFKSCKLALALEQLLDEEHATVMTVDCYGTMWDKTIKLPAYPCIGFTRLNNMGLGGICESDMRSALTHIIFQGLTGRPGFISDPTVDESDNAIILAHCLGTTKMDGPDGPAAPYNLRSIMEREEGAVPQVKMRIGQKVTQAILVGTDFLPYFTGKIVGTPVSLKDDRGCRTKITVEVDGDITKLWQNWSSGLHRQTCYGNIVRELTSFCRYMNIKMVNEAV